jgi:hypothetical protein
MNGFLNPTGQWVLPGRPPEYSPAGRCSAGGLHQLGIGAVAAVVTYGLGRLRGTTLT